MYEIVQGTPDSVVLKIYKHTNTFERIHYASNLRQFHFCLLHPFSFFFTFRLSLSAFMVKNVRTDIFKMDL